MVARNNARDVAGKELGRGGWLGSSRKTKRKEKKNEKDSTSYRNQEEKQKKKTKRGTSVYGRRVCSGLLVSHRIFT